MSMIGSRLKMARQARGLSMQQLAHLAGVSANMIKKYEHNISMPSSDVMSRLLDALKVSLDFLFRPFEVQVPAVVFRDSRIPKKLLKQLEVEVTASVEHFLALKELWTHCPLPAFSIASPLPPVRTPDDIETVAAHLRKAWELGSDAIGNLATLLASRGVIVVVSHTEQNVETFDGLLADCNGLPVIVVNAACTGLDRRFILARELGTLLFKTQPLPPNINAGQAALRFAAALLTPEAELLALLGSRRTKIFEKEWECLERRFGLPAIALLNRARELKVISANAYKTEKAKLFTRARCASTSASLYFPEEPCLFEQLVFRANAEKILGDSRAAELLGISVAEFARARHA